MRDLRLPVDVDPVSDARWERIEREMFAKLDAAGAPTRPLADERLGRAPWRGITGGVLAATTAVAAILLLVWRLDIPVHRGSPARLETTDSSSQFTIGESSLIVAPQSLVLVGGDDDHGIQVVLDRGAVTCIVAPRRGRPPFVVDAGDVRVRVVGTRFKVARAGGGARVDVDHGVVEVSAHGSVSSLHDGDRWPERLTESMNSHPSAAPPGSVPDSVPAPDSVPSEPSEPSAASERPLPRPAVVVSVRPRMPQPLVSSTAPSPVPGTVSETPGTGSPAAADSAPAPSASLSPSTQAQFEIAARIERTNPDRALGLYRELAAGGSAWAPNALFALARLEADRGQREDATQHLKEYLVRYPRGVNAIDARMLLQQVQ